MLPPIIQVLGWHSEVNQVDLVGVLVTYQNILQFQIIVNIASLVQDLYSFNL